MFSSCGYSHNFFNRWDIFCLFLHASDFSLTQAGLHCFHLRFQNVGITGMHYPTMPEILDIFSKVLTLDKNRITRVTEKNH